MYNRSLIKFSFSTINKALLRRNKDFSTNFRDSDEFHYLYNTNLSNIINSMFIIRKNFENLVFMGNNPDYFLKKIPKCKHNFNHSYKYR
jgi:hypothetical protein